MSTPGRLTTDQIEKAFSLLDAEGAGELEPHELLASMKVLGFGEMSEEDLQRLLFSTDTHDHDPITRDRFSRMMIRQAEMVDSAAEASAAFHLLDFTQTGKITFRSLKKVLRSLKITASDDVIRHMIAELDNDEDGAVTEQDFLRTLRRAHDTPCGPSAGHGGGHGHGPSGGHH